MLETGQGRMQRRGAGALLWRRLVRGAENLFLDAVAQNRPHRGEIVELGPRDMIALTLHYAALSPEDRLARFNGRIKFASLLRRYRDMKGGDRTFLGIFDGERLIAACEIASIPGDQEMAEIALSVRKAWQGRHHGQRLLRAALARVGDMGRRGYMIARRDNAPLIALAQSEGGEIERAGSEVTIEFPANGIADQPGR